MLGVCCWQCPIVQLWMCNKLCTYTHSYVLLHINLIFSVEVFSVFVCSVFPVSWMYFLPVKN